MTSPQSLPEPVDLESVVITSRLQERSLRQVDLQRENTAFRELADHFTAEPDKFLQVLVNQTLQLCEADTVGISVEEVDENGDRVFRWIAMAGGLKHLIGGVTPRNFSPCGVCVDQNQPLLMDHLDRFYPYFKDAPLPFVEALLIPWGGSDGPLGTLWIVAHSESRKFDREDVRLMSCLAAFAAGAIRLKQTVRETERAVAASQLVAAMAHHINNPLQAALLALYCARSKPDLNPELRELIVIAEAEVRRVAALSAELLREAGSTKVLIR